MISNSAWAPGWRPGTVPWWGEASLAVSVSQPSLLKLIPAKVLEATGRSLLAGILLGIKTRVGQQLISDFQRWCAQHAINPASAKS